MLADLQLNGWLNTFWQFNLDLSVIVLTVLVVRFFIRKTTKSYNSYLLWLAIPAGFLVAKVIASIDFSSASSSYIGQAVAAMIVKPVETLQNYWWLGAIWLGGSTILLLHLLKQHLKLRANLKLITRPTVELMNYGSLKTHKYSVIAVKHNDMSPAVYGFFKPRIYFPTHVAKHLTQQQMQLIIEHEEQHIKQKHLWLNLLWDILVCIGWFNPLLYIARKNFRHDQELFCDYLVLNNSDKSSSKAYGHALLSTVSATHSVSLLCSWKVFNQLEERIMNITKPINRKGKLSLTLGAALVLSCSAIYAANKDLKQNISIHETVDIVDGKEKHMVKYSEKEGVYFIKEDDKYFVNENGEKRVMTPMERDKFEQKLANMPKPPKPPKPPKAPQPNNGMAAKHQVSPIAPIPRPDYPETAYEHGVEGHVDLRFDVDQQGKAVNIRVSESEPDGVFDKEAITAVEQWKFEEDFYGKKDVKYKMEFALEIEEETISQ